MNRNDRKTKSSASGPGAAHVSWRMFAARGILLAPEDGAGGGGGAAAGAANGAAAAGSSTGGDPAGTPPPAGAKPSFTPDQQAEVNRIAARAREEGRQSVQQQTPPKKETAAAAINEPADVTELRREMDFRDSASDLGVPRDQRKDLYTWAKALGVADFGQWLESKRAMWSAPQQTETQQTQTQQNNPNGNTQQDQARTGNAAPPSSVGNKVDPVTSGGLVDFWHMTPQQLEQLGSSGVRREYEKHLAEANRRNGAPPIPKVMQRK